MAIFRVKDLFKLESMKNFQVVAGEKGMDKPINGAEILDFEFTQGAQMGRQNIFEGESVTLSSLLFAKGHPELILDAVKRLKEFNVSAFAYKPAIFSELPQEVIDYANREDFPILRFGGDEFFDQIIFDILSVVNREDDESANALNLRKLLQTGLNREQVSTLAYDINPYFKRYAMAVSIKHRDGDITQEALFSEVDERIKEKTAIIKHGDSFMLIITQEEGDANKFDALREDMCVTYDLVRGNVVMGQSTVKPCVDFLDRLVKEALWARIAAEIMDEREKRFQSIGIYQIIAPQIGSPALEEFTRERMSIIRELDGTGEKAFFNTAIAYVNAEGDVNKTAEMTYCHKNTVRYRLRKIQEKMDLVRSDKEFYQELSFAIRSYLFEKKLEEE